MPISNSNSSSLSEELINSLIEALSGGGFGGGLGIPAYRFAKVAEIDLLAGQQTLILAETPEKSLREVTITNLSEHSVQLIWRSQNDLHHFATIHPNETLQDNNDGGIRLEAVASQSAKIRVAVRSESEIFYEIGTETMPYFPVEVSLHFPTGANYPQVEEDDLTEPVTTEYETNLQRLFNSNDGTTGWKALSFNCFTPGEDLTITVEAIGNFYDAPIALQLIHPLQLVRVLSDVMSDLINPESSSLPDNFMGRITASGWVGEVNNYAGGNITFRPNFNRCMGRFVAKKPGTEYNDTCIIKEYQPNTDPLKGGKFILEGF